MKLSKTIRFVVRPREYENIHVEVECAADHHDLGFTNDGWAELDPQHRATFTDHLEIMVINEVDKLARQELETITEFAELTANLAEDYLSTNVQRNQHARSQKSATPAPTGRRIRRGGGGTTPTPAA